MATLRIAVKGNQAASIPALLVVTLLNDTQKASINTRFEDGVELMESKDKESLELVTEKGVSVNGGESVIKKLFELYPSLRTVLGEQVSGKSLA